MALAGAGVTLGERDWGAALAAASAPRSPYDRLNPLTRIVISVAGVGAAALAPAPIWPAVALVAFVALALAARRFSRLWRVSLTSGVVLAIVAGLLAAAVGEDPNRAAAEAIDVGLRAALAMLSVGLAAVTADPAALGLDLERRGLGRGPAFALAGLIAAWPSVGQRVATVSAAQQARGLRLGGGPLRRLRAVAPIWLPALVSTLAQLVDRSLALEARAFGHPGRRDLLWAPADPGWERVVRWLIGAAVVVAVALRLAQAFRLV